MCGSGFVSIQDATLNLKNILNKENKNKIEKISHGGDCLGERMVGAYC